MGKGLAFSGGFVLGLGFMYLLGSDRGARRSVTPSWAPASWAPGIQCIAGAASLAVMALGAKLIAQRGEETSTAFDVDRPDYAWLR
jgi:hypothetical protein